MGSFFSNSRYVSSVGHNSKFSHRYQLIECSNIPLHCSLAGTAGVNFGGFFNNRWWLNPALTSWMHCLRQMNLSVAPEYIYIEKIFIRFGDYNCLQLASPLSCSGRLQSPMLIKQPFFQYRHILMLQKASPASDNIFKKLKHSSVIFGCWNIHWCARLIFQQVHTSVDILTCNMSAC